jgi:LmbE family N-acetylglucosaminyl deacetylase
MSDHLEPVDESWSTAIAIVAHPDDLEYGAAAAIARWTDQGKHITYCLATSGEAGIDGMSPAQAGPLREQEQRASAAIVGVDAVEFWGYPDGTIEPSLALRRDVARAVRRYRPEVVVTGNYHDSWGPGSPNQADHVAVGRAVLDGVRDAANRWIFPELGDEGLSAWHAHTLLAANSPLSTHGVDITDHFDVGVASLEAHSAYLEGLGDNPMARPREILEAMARAGGTALGCRFAVSFELVAL